MESIINEFLKQVKANKKYKSIADEVVLEEINNYIEKNKITKITKQDIKKIRDSLHRSYASFQTKNKNKIKYYLQELKNNQNNKEITNKLLSITLSTKERLNDYKELYKKIFNITGIPKIIIDLGAGFNLFSFPFMKLSNLTYYSYDINQEDVDYLNQYFKIMESRGLNGGASIADVRNLREISTLPLSDIIFMFKLIDIIDKDSHKSSEELIKILIKKTKFIVVSFATKTLTRKNMNYPNRKWFELMLTRLKLKFQILKFPNEIFYIIK